MRHYLCTILLAGAFLVPATIQADDRDDHHRAHRYYDKEHHDYHEWNEQEERAYHRYVEEQKRENHAWGKASRKEQSEYWRWRHEHPDVR